MSQIIYLKWSPSVHDQHYEKSKLNDKHKAIGNNVMETILQEGIDFIKVETRREGHFNKINEREMVVQKNLNPFFSNNYLEDLHIQETFLTPQNSNHLLGNSK